MRKEKQLIKEYPVIDDSNMEHTVSEPLVLYYAQATASKVLDKIQSLRHGQPFFSDRMRVVQAIREGLPTPVFLQLKERLPFTDTDWASFLGISPKSFQRYKSDATHVFKSIHSEKILELVEVADLGVYVFEGTTPFYRWLHDESAALGGMRPFDLMSDSYGKELVMDALNAIDHCIFV